MTRAFLRRSASALVSAPRSQVQLSAAMRFWNAPKLLSKKSMTSLAGIPRTLALRAAARTRKISERGSVPSATNRDFKSSGVQRTYLAHACCASRGSTAMR